MTECPIVFLANSVTLAGVTMISMEVFDLLDIAQMWREGKPPIAGGSLDQPSYLRRVVNFIWSEENSHDTEALRKLKHQRK